MTIPNLAGVITKADVDTKGSGSFAASYVNWAKVAHLLHEHAPGWQFHLQQDEETGSYVFKAPDGTAYVVGFFVSPDNAKTADFPFPCMDMRNNPIPADKISARVLTDTHRRALCAAAAYTFGLAYELWAKDPVEDPHRDEAPAPAAKQAPAQPPVTAKKTDTPAQEPAPAAKTGTQRTKKEVVFLSDEQVAELKAQVKALHPDTRSALVAGFKAQFEIPEGVATIADRIQFQQHADFITNFIQSLPDP